MTRYIKPSVKHKVHEVQRNELIVKSYVQNGRHWHEHKHASVLVIDQEGHQSVTAQSHATHAANAVTADQCHELWFHTHVAE